MDLMQLLGQIQLISAVILWLAHRFGGGKMRKALAAMSAGALLATVISSQGAIIVNDSWADGGRTDGADLLDCNWWTTNSSSALEVSVGSMGLVTGTSGRGTHSTWAAQTLNEGDSLKATFTFTTPATVLSPGGSAGVRIGLFNSLGNAALAANFTTNNAAFDPPPGYMMDFDVNNASSNNIAFREKSLPSTSNQLLGTTTNFSTAVQGGTAYGFASNTTYTGVMMLTRTALGMDLSGSLSNSSGVLSSFTTTETTPLTFTYDMLAFHVISNQMGSSNVVNAADNGIDFSNIQIEVIVPEPAGLAVLGLFSCIALRRRA